MGGRPVRQQYTGQQLQQLPLLQPPSLLRPPLVGPEVFSSSRVTSTLNNGALFKLHTVFSLQQLLQQAQLLWPAQQLILLHLLLREQDAEIQQRVHDGVETQ